VVVSDEDKQRLAELKAKLRARDDKPGWKQSAEKIKAEIERLEKQ
jgi:hypothetical protein